jgi:hypothetical protein
MLEAFVDESEHDGLFVMAGYVASDEDWKSFSREWQALLDLDDHQNKPMLRLKMSTMARSRAYRRAELFYRVIERHVSAAFSISIPRNDLNAAAAEFNWPKWVVDQDRMTNPYYFAFRCVQEGLAHVLRCFNLKGPVQFTFDSHTSGPRCLEHWELLKASTTPEIATTFAALPLFRKEEEQLPLQASDLYAFWVRRWKQSGDPDAMKQLAFPWTPYRDIPRFDWAFAKTDFLDEWQTAKVVHALRKAGVHNASHIVAASRRLTMNVVS